MSSFNIVDKVYLLSSHWILYLLAVLPLYGFHAGSITLLVVTGAGLDHVSGYSETTSDDVCTQYSSHNCTVY